MYITAKLDFDPSQKTLIKTVNKSKLSHKLLDLMTFGKLAKKQETETFTAVSILEQIYMGLKSIGINNIIRLSVDDFDFYFDKHGKDDDFESAISEFKLNVDPVESELFNVIYMVLEHDDKGLKYLIEVQIKRKHEVGEYPLTIVVNAIYQDFKIKTNENDIDLIKRMQPFFDSQKIYDDFISVNLDDFNRFVDYLQEAVSKHVDVDDIIKNSNVNIIRTRERIDDISKIKHDRFSQPVYFGYFGFDDYFFYTWLWCSLMYDNNIYAHDFCLVDELGKSILKVSRNGFYAQDNAIMNPDVPFEPIHSSDIQYYSNSDYGDITND